MISYYDVLGVPRDANEAVIRDRFRVLARAAHPDRFSDPAKKSEAERRFQLLTEALNVLSNPTRRRTHDFDLDKGKANAEFDPENVARVYMAKGVRAYREGQFGDAVQSFELAVRHWGKDARSQHYLAISCLKAGGLERKASEAIEAAIRLDPENGVYYRDAGRIYVQAGLRAKAERYAEEALKRLPGDPEALRILSDGKPGGEQKNIFGSLFGRKG